MTQPLRIFNEAGLQAFTAAYSLARQSNPKQLMDVSNLLNDSSLTRVISENVDIEPVRFRNAFDCGQHLYRLLESVQSDLRAHNIDPLTSKRLWAWMSALWCPILQMEDDGLPAKGLTYGHVGEESRWVYEYSDRNRWYRHLLAAPYRIYSDFKDDPNAALILLDVDLIHPNSRRLEVICGSPNVYSNKQFVADLSRRFRNPLTGRIRDSVARFEDRSDSVGSFDRLTQVYNQLSKNYDMHQLSPNVIRNELMDDEFTELLNFE